MRIVIQSGHLNNEYSSLKLGSGAPNEKVTNKRIADKLSSMLRERGFEIIQTDANAYNDPTVTKQDHVLFLALHCDMDYPNDNGGGFADFPQPSTDGATDESQRICGIINDVYFKETKITLSPKSNKNTRYYYMWKYLTAKTPCVLIEMGQSIDPHDKVLLANTLLIASSLTRAICSAFGVKYDLETVEDPNDVTANNLKEKITNLNTEISTLKETLKQAGIKNVQALADCNATCQLNLTTFKNFIIKKVQEYNKP